MAVDFLGICVFAQWESYLIADRLASKMRSISNGITDRVDRKP